LDKRLDEWQIKGDRKSKIVQYCLQADPLESLLDEWFGVDQLAEICREVGLEEVYFSTKGLYIAYVLENLGSEIPPEPEGLPQSIFKVRNLLHQVNSVQTIEAIRGLASSAAIECERILRNLIRFHAIFLFQDAYLKGLKREVLGEHRKLIRGKLSHTSLGSLLETVNCFNKFVSYQTPETTWFTSTFQAESILELPKSWQQIAALRNKFAHDDPDITEVHKTEVRNKARNLTKMCLDLLEELQSMDTYPKVITVRKTMIDCYGRRRAECLGDDGSIHTVYTSLDLQPGRQFFLYSQSDPINVNPILVAYKL
jgi:hypothetical protein